MNESVRAGSALIQSDSGDIELIPYSSLPMPTGLRGPLRLRQTGDRLELQQLTFDGWRRGWAWDPATGAWLPLDEADA